MPRALKPCKPERPPIRMLVMEIPVDFEGRLERRRLLTFCRTWRPNSAREPKIRARVEQSPSPTSAESHVAPDDQRSLVRELSRDCLLSCRLPARSTACPSYTCAASSACSTLSRREISSDIILKSTSSEIGRSSLDASLDLATDAPHRREGPGQIKPNDACKLDLYTHRFRCAPTQNEHDAGKGRPPPCHSAGKRSVKTAERQFKFAGKHVIGGRKAGSKGVDVVYYTRMDPTNSIEGKQCRQIDHFARQSATVRYPLDHDENSPPLLQFSVPPNLAI